MRKDAHLLAGVVLVSAAVFYWARTERTGRVNAREDETTRAVAARAGDAGLAAILPSLQMDLLQISTAAHAHYAEFLTCGTMDQMSERGYFSAEKRGRYDYKYFIEPAKDGCAVVARYAGKADPPYPSYRLDEKRQFYQLD